MAREGEIWGGGGGGEGGEIINSNIFSLTFIGERK